jgi:hypothetical protein
MRKIAPVLVVALAAMALLPVAASAKAGHFKIPPAHVLQLLPARGTHGYGVNVAVLDGRPQLTAVRQSEAGASFVFYRQTKQRDTGDDLDADFGAAGKLKARFVPEKVQKQKAPKGCVGGPAVAEIGYFVGSLSFHGANDFTSFKVHRLRGAVTHFPGLVCRAPTGSDHRGSPIEPDGVLRVIAGKPSGSTYFDAVTEPAEDGIPSTSTYTASSEHREGSVDILESVEVPTPTPLAIPDLTTALPATVTIEPPAPFSGSATIEAPSRATATLGGDLAVDLPATGEVSLTGPGIDAGLCRDYACTGSLPKPLRPRRPTELGIGEVEIQTIR